MTKLKWGRTNDLQFGEIFKQQPMFSPILTHLASLMKL